MFVLFKILFIIFFIAFCIGGLIYIYACFVGTIHTVATMFKKPEPEQPKDIHITVTIEDVKEEESGI